MTHRTCVELFRLVDCGQVSGIYSGHPAGRLSLQGDDGLVISIFLAATIPVVATWYSRLRRKNKRKTRGRSANARPVGSFAAEQTTAHKAPFTTAALVFAGWTFMSVALPEIGAETEVTVPQEYSAFEALAGENSDMNVQATGIALSRISS